ncbi:IQ calmodulin-binding motif family protein [Tritrichomonas foetus]|uniref:non-specific serine/threonine protein kinase n=1 Tax=Tritrichomonas foetus TaxID=1144522 RepID=A0A1J4JIU3_9EUKA|nr:IQ calmodulin-binding motif family protein [Tritrichomonas foetus]|eukprot:OHS99070.1 IQ calmodulin-binding motif family protein [Tritrichomonas foetus]
MDHAIEMKAALTIQSYFRGYYFRTKTNNLDKENRAATKIQMAWKRHINRGILQSVKETIALNRIRRVILRFNEKLRIRRNYEKIHKLEPLLMFLPTTCNVPEVYQKARTSRKLDKSSRLRSPSTKSTKIEATPIKKAVPKKKGSGKKAKKKKAAPPLPNPMELLPKEEKKKAPPRKRKILIDLPPPWRGKDSRRISQSQMDDLLYDQKNDLAWIKSDILPIFLRSSRYELDQRDKLFEKNEKYKNRIVQKPFIEAKLRTKTHFKGSSPKSLVYLLNTGLYAMATTLEFIICKSTTFTDDEIFVQGRFDVNFPLLDIEISPTSGYFIGLDNDWKLRLFSQGRTIMTYELNPPHTLPNAKKFISLDNFGFLWVNLIPQKGNIYCFDILTFHPTIQINFDGLNVHHRFMRSNLSLIPLTYKEPLGFAGIFAERQELVLFPPDFSIARHLYNENLKKIPVIKQLNNRLFVWDENCTIFVYELKNGVNHMILIGSFNVDSFPVDIIATSEPDLIYIACDDNTLRVFLGNPVEYKIRLPNSKMTPKEEEIAKVMLGPQTYTNNCPIFKECERHRFSSPISKIAAFPLSSKLAMVTVAFQNCMLYSLWIFNNQQPVKCSEYGNLIKPTTIESQTAIVSEYKSEINKMMKRRHEFVETFSFLDAFDEYANKGQIQNIFQPNKPNTFDVSNFVKNISLGLMFPFLPDKEDGKFTCYEIFHYLKRSGIMPAKASNFYHFIKVLAPKEDWKIMPGIFNTQKNNNSNSSNQKKDNDAGEPMLNIKLPVYSGGLWNAIVNYNLDNEQIGNIVKKMDPLKVLTEQLSLFTFTDISKKEDKTIARKMLSSSEKDELTKRYDRLSMLEIMVKNEIMHRTQKNVDNNFNKNLMNKMIPVPSIDIYRHPDSNDVKAIRFKNRPNRNPLLDQRMHKSIFHKMAVQIQYGINTNTSSSLQALYIPQDRFDGVTKTHFELIRRVSGAMKKVSSEVYGVSDTGLNGKDTKVVVVITEDVKVLPLSHYLNIHSFLGGNSRLILAARTILSKILTELYKLHKAGIILRTLYPDNIMLNSQTEIVTIGNVYDCQTVSGNDLPLPEPFNDINNPFLPPEYFTDRPEHFTKAFDVWQFGILLLYVITGYLPPSYGSEMKKHENDSWGFFYDWLQGAPVVYETNQCTGDHGECFIQSDINAEASVLNLDHYTLLPYKSTKTNYDEGRMYLDIIASCLQIDPSKRPTVETLLRTHPFSQGNIGDILDQYMKNPNQTIYVREFFQPAFDNLSNETFDFSIGIASAILYKDEMAAEDEMYSFPIDSQSLEKINKALFDIHFLDILIRFVLNRIEKLVTLENMNTFKDETFSKLVHFFKRFITSVDRGQGMLIPYINDVILSLFATFTGNPYLRFSSHELQEKQVDRLKCVSSGSAALFVFTNSQLRSTVEYSLKSFFIHSGISRTTEHNNAYFHKFLAFSDSVLIFANAMTHAIERQRSNALFNMEQWWDNGQSPYIIRLFLDFRVPQMILHCLINQGAQDDCLEFLNKTFTFTKLKTFDPTYSFFQFSLMQPTLFLNIASFIRTFHGDDENMANSLDIVRRVLFGESSSAVAILFASDIIWSLADFGKIPSVHELLSEAINYGSKYVFQLLVANSQLTKQFESINIKFVQTPFDINALRNPQNLQHCLDTAKRLSAALFICQNETSSEFQKKIPPLYDSAEFIVTAIKMTLSECDSAAASLESDVQQTTRFDLKGTTYQKAKNTAKATDFGNKQAVVIGLCDTLLHLFRCICFYWRSPEALEELFTVHQINKHMFEFILHTLPLDIPECRCMPHLSYRVHHCIQEMALHCIVDLPDNSSIRETMTSLSLSTIFFQMMKRDVTFIKKCVETDVVEIQLMDRYPKERQIRLQMFETIVCDRQLANTQPLINYVIHEMLYDHTQFKGTCWSKKMQLPIRSEAVSMITRVLNQRDVNDIAARKVADELSDFDFLSKEKELNVNDLDQQFSPSSISLLKSVVQCEHLFDSSSIRTAKSQLEGLQLRYSNDWMNIKNLSSKDPLYDTGPGLNLGSQTSRDGNGRGIVPLPASVSPMKGSVKAKLNLRQLASVKKVIKSTAASSRKPEAPNIIQPKQKRSSSAFLNSSPK